MKKILTVVIIGRINVGKSALFNRLTETNKAIVSPVPGTTRDYNISEISWRKKTFKLIDTGGVNIETLKNSIESLLIKAKRKIDNSGTLEQEIIKQTQRALQKADLILVVVDGQAGLLPEDKKLALVVKKLKIPTLLVVNKVDNQKYRYQINEFFKLGLGNPVPVSAINGSGTGDLLDEVAKLLKSGRGRPKKNPEQQSIKVALVGKPNVGKSSLVNKILGEERVIVSDIPQTTREPQDTEITYKNQRIALIDTAGLRRKSKIHPGLEKIVTAKTILTLKRADIALVIIEANKTISSQDRRLMDLTKDCQAGIIVVANKWDLVDPKTQNTSQKIEQYFRQALPYLSWTPIIFVSAKTGQRVDKILDLVLTIWQEKQKEVNKNALAKILKKTIKKKRPVKAVGQKRPHLYQLIQTKVNPPEFTVIIGKEQSLHLSYRRFIENQIRKHFGFFGLPVIIKVKTLKK